MSKNIFPLGPALDLGAMAAAFPDWDREKEALESEIQGHFPGPAPSGYDDPAARKGRDGKVVQAGGRYRSELV